MQPFGLGPCTITGRSFELRPTVPSCRRNLQSLQQNVKLRLPLIVLVVCGLGPVAGQAQNGGIGNGDVPGDVSAFVSSLATHPGVDAEIARFEDGRLEPEYRQTFAGIARERVSAAVEALLSAMLETGCSAEVSVDFPGERFTGIPEPTSKQKDFEDSVVFTRSTACYATELTPEELLALYSSRDVRMAAQSRMEDVYQEDGLTCYAVGGVPLLLSPTRSCNEVHRMAGDGVAADHSQTVRSEARDHQPVFFKESLKAAVRLDDGAIGLVHVTLTRSTGLGGLEKRLGRGKIEDSLREQTRVLAERLRESGDVGPTS